MAGVLQYALSLKTSAFTGPMGAATGAVRGLASAAGTAASAIAKVAAPLAALGGGVGVFAALNKAANFEQLSVSLGVLVGNATEAQAVMQKLKSFSNATPFEFADIADAGKTLIALGGSTKTVISELSALGDIASGLSIPLGELATAYGKARNDGVLYAETLNQFNDKGIPVISNLARLLNVSTTEIKKMASEGQITFPQLQKVLSDLTAEGGQFHGMMQKQSVTTRGLLSTLKSALDSLLVSIGTPINDFLKPILSNNIARMQALNQRVVAFLQLLGQARDQGKLGDFIGASLQVALLEGLNTFAAGIRSTAAFLGASLSGMLGALSTGLKSSGIMDVFEALANVFAKTIAAGISRSLAVLPGFSDAADDYEKMAAGWKSIADSKMAVLDFGKGIEDGGKAMAEAWNDGQRAARQASSSPLIDTQPARDKLESVATGLDPKAWQNLINPPVAAAVKEMEALETALGGLNTAIEKAKPKPAAANEGANFGPGPAAEDAPAPRRRGLLNAAESIANRVDRASAQDRARKRVLGRTDDLAVEAEERRNPRPRNFINPARAANALALANRGAGTIRSRREDRDEAARKAADPMYRAVKNIEQQFANLATA